MSERHTRVSALHEPVKSAVEKQMHKIPESIGSKYRFIILAGERARQLQNNANPKFKTLSKKPSFIAMRELEMGLLSFEITPPVEISSSRS
jgi:DNA-directed RNA polymerase omega subunit